MARLAYGIPVFVHHTTQFVAYISVLLLVYSVKHNRVGAIPFQALAIGLVAKHLTTFPAHDTTAFVTNGASVQFFPHLLHSLYVCIFFIARTTVLEKSGCHTFPCA
jgi:hypothetical protein